MVSQRGRRSREQPLGCRGCGLLLCVAWLFACSLRRIHLLLYVAYCMNIAPFLASMHRNLSPVEK